MTFHSSIFVYGCYVCKAGSDTHSVMPWQWPIWGRWFPPPPPNPKWSPWIVHSRIIGPPRLYTLTAFSLCHSRLWLLHTQSQIRPISTAQVRLDDMLYGKCKYCTPCLLESTIDRMSIIKAIIAHTTYRKILLPGTLSIIDTKARNCASGKAVIPTKWLFSYIYQQINYFAWQL